MKQVSQSFHDMTRARKVYEELEKLESVMPFIRALYLGVGKDASELEDLLAKARQKAEEFSALNDTYDQFNERFSAQGWIISDSMTSDIVAQANRVAEEKGMLEAERILLDYYDKENIERHLRRMSVIPEFKPRIRLAGLALADHLAERYHACVPVILMLADGLSLDLSGKLITRVDLSQESSLVGHDTGLPALQKEIGKSRSSTNIDELDVPFRHGIMHGRDINYDNVKISSKAWGFLFAIGDWALRVKYPNMR